MLNRQQQFFSQPPHISGYLLERHICTFQAKLKYRQQNCPSNKEATLWLLPVAGLHSHGHLQSGHCRGTNSTSSALLQDKWYTAPKYVESFSVPQKCIVQKQFSLINSCRCFIQLCCAKFQVWVLMPVVLTPIHSPSAIWLLNAFCCRGWSPFSSYGFAVCRTKYFINHREQRMTSKWPQKATMHVVTTAMTWNFLLVLNC